MSEPNHVFPNADVMDRERAKRGLLIYLVLVALLSTPLYIGMISTNAFEGDRTGLAWLALFMCVPTAASFTARKILSEGFSDLSWRHRTEVGRRATRRALLLPPLAGLAAYGIGLVSGAIRMDVPPLLMWLALIAVNIFLNVILATGEELGWRGYMVPRLIGAGVPAPLATGGLVWGLWHAPLYLWTGMVEGDVSPLGQTALMLVLTTALGYVLGRLQVIAGVWGPVALHVTWNVVIQTVFDPIARGADKYLWVGEVGVLTASSTVLLAVAYRLRPWGVGAVGRFAISAPSGPKTRR